MTSENRGRRRRGRLPREIGIPVVVVALPLAFGVASAVAGLREGLSPLPLTGHDLIVVGTVGLVTIGLPSACATRSRLPAPGRAPSARRDVTEPRPPPCPPSRNRAEHGVDRELPRGHGDAAAPARGGLSEEVTGGRHDGLSDGELRVADVLDGPRARGLHRDSRPDDTYDGAHWPPGTTESGVIRRCAAAGRRRRGSGAPQPRELLHRPCSRGKIRGGRAVRGRAPSANPAFSATPNRMRVWSVIRHSPSSCSTPIVGNNGSGLSLRVSA